jgi:hypothetical protein
VIINILGTLIRCGCRKKEDFTFEEGTGVRMQGGERKNVFIEDNITRNINATSGDIQTLNTLVERTIAKKNTARGTES